MYSRLPLHFQLRAFFWAYKPGRTIKIVTEHTCKSGTPSPLPIYVNWPIRNVDSLFDPDSKRLPLFSRHTRKEEKRRPSTQSKLHSNIPKKKSMNKQRDYSTMSSYISNTEPLHFLLSQAQCVATFNEAPNNACCALFDGSLKRLHIHYLAVSLDSE